jgi:hypothetical protein
MPCPFPRPPSSTVRGNLAESQRTPFNAGTTAGSDGLLKAAPGRITSGEKSKQRNGSVDLAMRRHLDAAP